MGIDGARGAALLVVLLAAGCGGTARATAETAKAKAVGVARFLPLQDGTVFSYETLASPSGERGLLVLEVRRRLPDVAELVVAGRARRVNVTTNAVAHVTGGFLLREPLSVGANWQGDFGHVRVTSVDRKVVVPAGSFEGCVETVEEMTSNAGTKRTVTAYCPDVGIALRETEAEQEGTAASERIALKSFGKRFEAGPGNISQQ